jgi:hypothetical protein
MRTSDLTVLSPPDATPVSHRRLAPVVGADGISTRILLDLIAAFAIPLSVLLAPLRFGLFEILRPTLLITLPCVLFLLFSHHGWVDQLLRTRLGLGTVILSGLFGLGHFFGHDVLD